MQMKVALGCRALDDLLGGGVEEGCITLLHGEAGSGKTNFCLQLARNVVRAGHKVIYIDTEGVSLDRLQQICGDDFDVVAKNILFSEPYSFEEQEKLIEKAVKLADGNPEVGLIVIDSITMHYRLTMRDETRRDERYGLTRQIAKLLRASRVRGIPVVVTSQVYTDIDTGLYMPLGGHMLSHNAKTIVRLERTGVSTRAAAVRTKEGPPIFGREFLYGEDEERCSLPLPDVSLRRSTDSRLDDAGPEKVVAILECNREMSRECLERRTIFGRRTGRDRRGRGGAQVEASRLRLAHPHIIRLGDSIRPLKVDVESLAIAENQIDLGQLRKEFEPDRRMEIRGALDGPLRQRSNAQRVEDRLGHPVSMALGPKDHGRAVRTGAAVQLRIRGPCAGEGTPPDVLVHDVVQEPGVQMVPFEPRRGALEAAGRCLSRQELIPGEGEGVPIPLSRPEESRVVPHRPARWECTDRMFRRELLPNRLDVGVRSVAVWFQQGFESVLRRRGRKGRHRSRLSSLEPARGRRTHNDGTIL